MPTAYSPAELINALVQQPPGAVVRILLRPLEHRSAGESSQIDPKRFSSAFEYRSALIARQKERTQPAKDAVMAMARGFGLEASAAGSLNAVVVQGDVTGVLRLLEQAELESASLEQDIGG